MKHLLISVPAPLSPYQAYLHFKPLLDDVEAVICNRKLAVVMANIDTAFRVIVPRLEEVPTLLPKFDLGYVLDMPNLARAASYAAGRVASPLSSGTLAAKLATARLLRDPMLRIAEGLAVMTPKPLLPRERVAKIRAGRGAYDTAKDLTDLVGLYREFAPSLQGQHPFDVKKLNEADEVGAWLQERITPTGAIKVPPTFDKAPANLRDRMWASLLLRDAKLRVLARVLFEEDAKAMVPALLAHTVARGSREPVATEPVTPSVTSPVA